MDVEKERLAGYRRRNFGLDGPLLDLQVGSHLRLGADIKISSGLTALRNKSEYIQLNQQLDWVLLWYFE